MRGSLALIMAGGSGSHENEKCMIGLDLIPKQTWDIVSNTNDSRLKLQAMGLINEATRHKEDLLSNVTIIDSAINFVTTQHNYSNRKKRLVLQIRKKSLNPKNKNKKRKK